VPHAADWLLLGITETTLLIVRGLTIKFAVIGAAVPVSRIVRVTLVSAATGLGTSVKELAVTVPTFGIAAWLLDVMTYVPVPPLTKKELGSS
jgi:hypothetical protein